MMNGQLLSGAMVKNASPSNSISRVAFPNFRSTVSVASEFMQTFEPSGSTMSSFSPRAVRYSSCCTAPISVPFPASGTAGTPCQNQTAQMPAAKTAAAAT